MLDFSFIRDGQPMHTAGLNYAGEIEYEEFEKAQDLGLVEKHLNYYGKFRWSSQQVRQKRALLIPAVTAEIPTLASILKQAWAGECGLVAFGD